MKQNINNLKDSCGPKAMRNFNHKEMNTYSLWNTVLCYNLSSQSSFHWFWFARQVHKMQNRRPMLTREAGDMAECCILSPQSDPHY